MKKTILTIVMAVLCLIFKANAQSTTMPLRGKITDERNQPLSGATIRLKGTSRASTSDAQGNFTINVTLSEGILVVSFLGYLTQELQFSKDNADPFKVILKEDENALKEVEINAGYYTVKDKERTGSISRVTAETIGKQPVNNVLGALIGRMPGIEIVQSTGLPGGGFSVRIRGQNSIANGNEPLYIVDGIPFTQANLSSYTINNSVIPYASPLSAINPSDIESIEVLKDADATAIYGSRGANGVVLITTKRGEAGRAKVNFQINSGAAKAARRVKLLNTNQYIEMRKEAFANDQTEPGATDYDINGTWDQNRYTDWQEELIGGTATVNNMQASLSGGSANTTFLLSGTYYKEKTVFPGSNNYLKRSSLLNFNHASDDHKFKLQSSVSYGDEDSSLPQIDLTSFILLPPNAPAAFTSDGSLNWENGTFQDNPMQYFFKPYHANTRTLNASGNLSYLLLPGLAASTRIGYVRMDRDETQATPLASLDPAGGYTAASRSAYFAGNWNQVINFEPQLSFSTALGPGELKLMAGATFQASKLHAQTLQGTGFNNDGLMGNIMAASTLRVRDVLNTDYRYTSAYGRINYNLRDTYYLNLTGRRDGSSRFGSNNLFANFGALGLGYIFSNEQWAQNNLSFLSFGKLRFSYGISGNDQIGDYNYLELWKTTTNPYQNVTGLFPDRISNADYAWETNVKMEAALELGFWKDRIHMTMAGYRNRSSNQLVRNGLPPSSGFTFIQANLPATVQNTGWEFDLSTRLLDKSTLKWAATANLSIPRNKLIDFPNLDKSFYADSYVVGKSLNIVKNFQFAGVDPVLGIYTYKDFTGDGIASFPDDAKIINELGVRYSGGIQNSLSYKGLRLDFLFQFSKQTGRLYNGSIGMVPGQMSNQPDIVIQRWKEAGDMTSIQKYTVAVDVLPYLYGRAYGNQAIGDASYLQLKNVSVSYDLSPHILKHIGLKSLTISLQGQNLLMFSGFLGLNPESQSFFSLPPLRTLTAGLQVSF